MRPGKRILRFFSDWVYERRRLSARRFLTGLAISLLSGGTLGLAFPLTDVFPLAWIALIPLLVIQRGVSFGRMWFYSFSAGLAFWLVHASWLSVFHPLSLVTAVPALALYFSLPFCFLGIFQAICKKERVLVESLLFSFFWVGVEYFRSTGFLGFSWGVLGYSQYLFLPLIQLADLGGVWLVSWLVAFSNGLLSGLISWQDPRQRSRQALVLVGVLILSLGYGLYRLQEKPSGKTKRLGLVQAFVDPAKDWKLLLKDQTMERIEALTREAATADPRPDLVVWSETLSSPAAYWYHQQTRGAALGNESRRLGEWFVGMPARVDRPILLTAPHRALVGLTNAQGKLWRELQSYNGAFLVDQTTNLIASYYKIRLVPFGEWFPYKKEFPWIARILQETIASDFTPGREYTVFRMPQGSFGVMICFEDIFGELCRRLVLAGADYLINTTNDYWSKSIQSQEQHAAMAVLRAIENRRYLVRAANTGVTCLIDAWGRILKRLPNEVSAVLPVELDLMEGRGPSFYTLHGDWLGIGGAWLCGLALSSGLIRRVLSLALRLGRRLGARLS